jgi:fatty acid desaturase
MEDKNHSGNSSFGKQNEPNEKRIKLRLTKTLLNAAYAVMLLCIIATFIAGSIWVLLLMFPVMIWQVMQIIALSELVEMDSNETDVQ